jgi:muramoyltetrapeptide carboxypeptidase
MRVARRFRGGEIQSAKRRRESFVEIVKPKKLKRGDTIGIIAPSGFIVAERFDAAIENLRNFGFNVVVHPQCYEREFVTAGNIDQRLTALHEMFANPKIDAIFTATGGLRSMQLLDHIDYDLIRKNPKIFLGYSDTTFLLSAFNRRAGLATMHGISAMSFNPERSQEDQKNTIGFLTGTINNDLLSAAENVETIFPGDARGKLFGGNFCLVNSLSITADAYLPALEGALLMLEEVGEEIRMIDRMLMDLRRAGVFDKIGGLILGHMTDIRDGGTTYKFDCTVRDLVTEHLADKNIPVIYGAPFGHEAPNSPFPIGIKARLTAPENGQPQLQLLESPFSDG